MQVMAGAFERDLDIAHAAQQPCDRGLFQAPHGRVTYNGDIRTGEFFGIGFEERDQIWATGFFFAFKQHSDFARRPAVDLVPSAEAFKPSHHLAFVVHRTPGNDALTAFGVYQLRFKRRCVPKLQWLRRLHVIMAVIQDMGRGLRTACVRPRMMHHDHWMARRLTFAAGEPKT